MLSRETVLTTIRQALEPLDYIQAVWEGGAAAFGRVDEWSDIDLQIAADDDHVGQVLPLVEQILLALSPISTRYEIPQPAWHGHLQIFYQLEQASPFLMLDVVAMKVSATNRFLEREIHGRPVVHFDKIGFTQPPLWDEDAWQQQLETRRNQVKVLFFMFQTLILKELPRKNYIEALAFYHSYTLRPLVELLRISYVPTHYNFGSRYIYYDLPAGIVQRLEQLYFVANPADLAAKHAEAVAWFAEQVNDNGPHELS